MDKIEIKKIDDVLQVVHPEVCTIHENCGKIVIYQPYDNEGNIIEIPDGQYDIDLFEPWLNFNSEITSYRLSEKGEKHFNINN